MPMVPMTMAMRSTQTPLQLPRVCRSRWTQNSTGTALVTNDGTIRAVAEAQAQGFEIVGPLLLSRDGDAHAEAEANAVIQEVNADDDSDVALETATVTLTNTSLLSVDALAYATATGEDADADADARAVEQDAVSSNATTLVGGPLPAAATAARFRPMPRPMLSSRMKGPPRLRPRRSTSGSMPTLPAMQSSGTQRRASSMPGRMPTRTAPTRKATTSMAMRQRLPRRFRSRSTRTAPARQRCTMRARSGPRRKPSPRPTRSGSWASLIRTAMPMQRRKPMQSSKALRPRVRRLPR